MSAAPASSISALPVAGRWAGLVAGAGLALATSGCLRQEVAMVATFDEAAHAPYIAKGSAKIEGEGFIRRPNAWLARCSGGIVFLVPATPYFREWLAIYRSGGRVANAKVLHETHGKAIRQTQCDALGRFEFKELPAGRWIAVTNVTYQGEEWSDDSTLAADVETRPGATASVVLSNPNRI